MDELSVAVGTGEGGRILIVLERRYSAVCSMDADEAGELVGKLLVAIAEWHAKDAERRRSDG